MAKRFEVRPRGKQFRVYDTKDKKYLTVAIPDKAIADEIADDFEAMSKSDYRPLGLLDFSANIN